MKGCKRETSGNGSGSTYIEEGFPCHRETSLEVSSTDNVGEED
jgi:hypothetical protein